MQDGASFSECKCQVSNREHQGRECNPLFVCVCVCVRSVYGSIPVDDWYTWCYFCLSAGKQGHKWEDED